jgi:hypothetical protein
MFENFLADIASAIGSFTNSVFLLVLVGALLFTVVGCNPDTALKNAASPLTFLAKLIAEIVKLILGICKSIIEAIVDCKKASIAAQKTASKANQPVRARSTTSARKTGGRTRTTENESDSD